jgi:DNA primase
MCALPAVESFFHKFSFYNIDKAIEKRVLLVEGVFDLFKLVQASKNFNVIASFGTSVRDEQLQLLRKRYKEVIILFDPEEKAQSHAMKIKSYLESYGVKCTNIKLKGNGDPGDLDLKTAKFLVDTLLGKEK